MATVQLIIKGNVQGVFFRASAKEVADEVGVRGWVKNTVEGYVEIVATGTGQQLQKFEEWCHIGPSRAQVSEVVRSEMTEQFFEDFKVIRKAG
jgi:acylphosphatase